MSVSQISHLISFKINYVEDVNLIFFIIILLNAIQTHCVYFICTEDFIYTADFVV